MIGCKLTHPGIGNVTTSLDKLPYKKNFPPRWIRLLMPVWISYIGLVASVSLAILLSRIFALDWDTYQRMNAKMDQAVTGSAIDRFVIWTYTSDPWLGLAWGAFVGTVMVLQLNDIKRRNLDLSAERMIHRRRFMQEIRMPQTWFAIGIVVLFVVVNLCGAYLLNVSPKTSVPAHMIPMFLAYRTERRIYELAKEKYVAALSQGLIPGGKLGASRSELVSFSFAVAVGIGIPIGFLLVSTAHWSDFGEIRDMQLETIGSTRTPQEAQALERQLERNPNDRDAHVILASYYGSARFEAPEADRHAMRRAYYRHTLWLIAHAPEYWGSILLYPRDGKAYEEARRLWQRNIETHPDNPKVLMNAAKFFDDSDPALAEEILRKGQVLEPANPKWEEQITELHSQQLKRAERDLDNKDVLEQIPYNDEDD